MFSCFCPVTFVVVHSDQTRSLGRLHPLRSAFTPSPSIHHCAAPLASLKLVRFLDLLFSKLDLNSLVSFPPSCVISPRFSASQLPNTKSFDQIRPPRASAGSHLPAHLHHAPANVRQTPLLGRYYYFMVFLLLSCCISYVLLFYVAFVFCELLSPSFLLVCFFSGDFCN
jgi:hypothetical protein